MIQWAFPASPTREAAICATANLRWAALFLLWARWPFPAGRPYTPTAFHGGGLSRPTRFSLVRRRRCGSVINLSVSMSRPHPAAATESRGPAASALMKTRVGVVSAGAVGYRRGSAPHGLRRG